MEAVTLSEYSLQRIRDAMPVSSCHAGAVAAAVTSLGHDVHRRLDELDQRLEVHASGLVDSTRHPRGVAARELYRRGRAAALAGWREEASTDFGSCLLLDPYLAAAHLAHAYVSEMPDAAVMESLALAVKYGKVVDEPVAARAVLELAAMLVERDRKEEALHRLNDVAREVDSVAVALAAARLAGDEEAQTRLRKRAPRYLDRFAGDRLGATVSRKFGQELHDVLACAADAKLPLDSAHLPQPTDAYDIEIAYKVADHIRTLAAERWPDRPADARGRLAEAREQKDSAQQALESHRSRPPVLKIVYERRLQELEAGLAASEMRFSDAQRAFDESEVETRERLDVALERLIAGYDEPDDVGVAPLSEGVHGLPAEPASL